MKKWLRSWVRMGPAEESEGRAIEILVVEGRDLGQKFTADGDEILIGRQGPKQTETRGIFLYDPSVSIRQALIRHDEAGYSIEHLDGATNPTLVDGKAITVEALRPGMRIGVGRTTMEVRNHQGISLSNLTQVIGTPLSDAETRTDFDHADTETIVIPRSERDTEAHPIPGAPGDRVGELVVTRGFDADTAPGRRFTIQSRKTLLGRGQDMDIQLPDLGISRRHAELECQDDDLYLQHLSSVNPTLLNGRQISKREKLNHGDEIQLAGRVTFRIELDRVLGLATDRTVMLEVSSLQSEIEKNPELDPQIEERYTVEGSFLDVDVVDSYGMKSGASRAEHIIVSFERFRTFVADVVSEFGGLVLNSNGDELMCYFESSYDAVKAGSEILSRLERFNRDRNRLSSPFRFRIGIHTGRSLVDLDRGVAYSVILDTAGHLQKHAETNGMAISQSTLDGLDPQLPFESAGTLEVEGIAYYRLASPIE